MSGAVASCERNLRPKIEKLLTDVRNKSGQATAKDLVTRLRTASAARQLAPRRVGFTFDASNPEALAWAKEHAAELVQGISETTREEIRSLIEDVFADTAPADELSDAIAEAIGDDARAEVIARTETMKASNEGVQEAWNQAVDEGLLTGKELQVWIVTDDDRLCPICEPLDGETAAIDGEFESDGETYDGPPAHPNCRCTVGLQIGE
jgi:SPP1 gp7 family putative phage head morphogenesis protein